MWLIGSQHLVYKVFFAITHMVRKGSNSWWSKYIRLSPKVQGKYLLINGKKSKVDLPLSRSQGEDAIFLSQFLQIISFQPLIIRFRQAVLIPPTLQWEMRAPTKPKLKVICLLLEISIGPRPKIRLLFDEKVTISFSSILQRIDLGSYQFLSSSLGTQAKDTLMSRRLPSCTYRVPEKISFGIIVMSRHHRSSSYAIVGIPDKSIRVLYT